ncbi:PAS domain S-box-containing protein/diguanylate cyclase (GGDEF) domain-containing protein [Clostridium cavendishii DSM 21758]|uniref:PAS domain S-box-containing protein/diguanylate cyclase (GGDEF) domain-containing protein n=1 Tax=Clostridium cavendishii DSM 21758 TaxID=1121302 RepID=A0A1M6T7K7_9CLOT|nr:HD domain-containing phosphohydrolase [Clostridium cavendishii]SHK52943.1 PAS domain S-box-containing protein/diguanylate cyclase (GGDEF) domain-containing protein [Clostridium cavendishii DSM 21758]
MEKLIQIILDNLSFSVWLKDVEGRFLIANKSLLSFFKVRKNNLIDKTVHNIFPSDIANVHYLEDLEVIKNKKPLKKIRKFKNAVLEIERIPIIDENGEVKFILGTLRDITIEKKYQDEIIKQKGILDTIINTIPDVIFYKDTESRYLGGNLSFKKTFLDRGITDIIGKNDVELHENKEQALAFMEKDKDIIKNKVEVFTKAKFLTSSGDIRYMESIKVPIVNEEGEAWGIVGVSRDVTNKMKMEEELIKLSCIDTLTGLYNRAYFEKEAVRLNQEQYLPLSIIMGDVNGLKIVNDTLGHLEGDEYLKTIASTIKAIFNGNTSIFRWGGDEVAILLPNIDEAEANNICKKIFKACKNYNYKPIPLSISLGTSSRYNLDKSINDMLKEAEDKVYRQKLVHSKSVRGSLIDSLQMTLAEKSEETEKHTMRLVENAITMGEYYNFTTAQLDELALLASLHDIGKIGIPETILNKPGKLTYEEMEIMKTHTEIGFRIAQASQDLAYIANQILTHHERWDGKGYPLGLSGNQIPINSRIISIIDSYDAMTNDRVYKKAISKEDSMKELRRCSGTQFDPEIVEVFIKNII